MPRSLLLLAAALLAITAALTGQLASADLTPSEAFHRLLSLRFEPASLAGPSGTALLLLLTESLPPLAQRALPPLAWLLAATGIYLLTKFAFGKKPALFATLAWALLPAASSAVTTFSPAIFAAAAWALLWASLLRATRSDDPLLALLAATATIAAIYFSYYSLLLYPALALFLLLQKIFPPPNPQNSNPFSLSFFSLLLLLLPLAAAYPLYRWNAQTHWLLIPKNFQALLTPDPSALLQALPPLALSAGGLLLLSLLLAYLHTLLTSPASPQIALLACAQTFALLALLLALYQNLPHSEPLLLFTILTLPSAANAYFNPPRSPQQNSPLLPLLRSPHLAALSLLSALLIHFYQQNVADLPPRRDWQLLAQKLLQTQSHFATESKPFLIAQTPELASLLGASLAASSSPLDQFPPIFVPESQSIESQFSLWPRYDEFLDSLPTPTPTPGTDPFLEQKGSNPYLNRNALYLTQELPTELPSSIRNAFLSIQLLHTILYPDGTKFYLYLCHSYQTSPL